MAGEQWTGTPVAAELAQLREVGGGEEGGNASRTGIAGRDDAAAGAAPRRDERGEVGGGDGGLVADGNDGGVAVACGIEGGDQGAGHAGCGGGVLDHAQWQAGQQRAMLGGARPEHDDGHGEAGIEEQARGAGEHGDAADERRLLICPEALAAAGGEQDAGHAGGCAWGGHPATVAARVLP